LETILKQEDQQVQAETQDLLAALEAAEAQLEQRAQAAGGFDRMEHANEISALIHRS
jgi:hypothetical protein